MTTVRNQTMLYDPSHLKPSMDLGRAMRAPEISDILNRAGVEYEVFASYIVGTLPHLDKALAEHAESQARLSLEKVEHEDGSLSIVFEVFTTLPEPAIEVLDEAILNHVTDAECWGMDLPRVTSILVRPRVASILVRGLPVSGPQHHQRQHPTTTISPAVSNNMVYAALSAAVSEGLLPKSASQEKTIQNFESMKAILKAGIAAA